MQHEFGVLGGYELGLHLDVFLMRAYGSCALSVSVPYPFPISVPVVSLVLEFLQLSLQHIFLFEILSSRIYSLNLLTECEWDGVLFGAGVFVLEFAFSEDGVSRCRGLGVSGV